MTGDHASTTGPMDSREPTWAGMISAGVGESVGPYRLLSVIGEGGFGIVYLAEQRSPIARRVALKVIKPGMDSKAVVARFEQERQALAVMDHPSVARVYDAGTTVRGHPYFAMEYVPGEPITDYCDKHRLTTRQRLELFIPVCEAVQHAHTKGVIHRDLKPGNVLVVPGDATHPEPTPKVIDFGVAKAISQTLTEKTIFTEQGQIIGTPEYMSPEQAEMGPTGVDTRSDVYSLGVMLYQLLTGMLPFDSASLRAAGYAEIQRIIREVEPPRPSTRLSTIGAAGAAIAERRRSDTGAMTRELRRELEWVPLKAMRKDRNERYGSPADLGRDIRNYLRGMPLEAGPESAVYRVRKAMIRNRRGIVVGLLLCCVASLVGTTVYLRSSAAELRSRQVLSERHQEESRELRRLSLLDVLGELDRAKAEQLAKSLAERVEDHSASADEIDLAHRLSATIELVGRRIQLLNKPDLAVMVRAGRFHLPALTSGVSVHVFIDGGEITPASGFMYLLVPGPANSQARSGFVVAQPGTLTAGIHRLRAFATARLLHRTGADDALSGIDEAGMRSRTPIDQGAITIWDTQCEFTACDDFPKDYPLAIPNARVVEQFEAGIKATVAPGSASQTSAPKLTLRLEFPFPEQPIVFEVLTHWSSPGAQVRTQRLGVIHVSGHNVSITGFASLGGDSSGSMKAVSALWEFERTDLDPERLEEIVLAGTRDAALSVSTLEAYCPFTIIRRVESRENAR